MRRRQLAQLVDARLFCAISFPQFVLFVWVAYPFLLNQEEMAGVQRQTQPPIARFGV